MSVHYHFSDLDRAIPGAECPECSDRPWRPLPSGFIAGARVVRSALPARAGTITRIIDHGGSLAGLVEVRWDGDARPSRSAGFFSPDELTLQGDPAPDDHLEASYEDRFQADEE